MTDRQMFRLADTAKIHHKDSDSGAFMICDRSLELEMTGSDKDVSSRSRKEVKE
ncbi:MAG TPA: hypothetical protein VJV05_09690 [Pyrinomonadaceae bacterium]|nr:hypothetical protein [Pyrinomonadaceae bacterium]